MFRIVTQLTIIGAVTLFSVGGAEARIFQPQAHWWSSGQTCVATRDPPGLRWDSLPPRACVSSESLTLTQAPRVTLLIGGKGQPFRGANKPKDPMPA